MIEDSWRQKVTNFLTEYLKLPKEAYNDKGLIPDCYMCSCLIVLLMEGVFYSPKDLQNQAYKDYGILIPMEMMKAVGE